MICKNNGPGSTVHWLFVSLVYRIMLPPYFSFFKALHILMIRQENILKIDTQLKPTIQTHKHRSDIWPLGETILELNDWIFSFLIFFGFKRLLCKLMFWNLWAFCHHLTLLTEWSVGRSFEKNAAAWNPTGARDQNRKWWESTGHRWQQQQGNVFTPIICVLL